MCSLGQNNSEKKTNVLTCANGAFLQKELFDFQSMSACS